MPNAMLKGMVMNGLTEEDGNMDLAIAKACEFMQEKLDSLSQCDLASRLTLNCTPSFVQPHLVNDLPVTVLDVWDDCALSQQVRFNTVLSRINRKFSVLFNHWFVEIYFI